MNRNQRRNELSRRIIGAAIEVHRRLGPGLLESAYERCLGHEFAVRGIEADRQVALPIEYKEQTFECGYRLDFLVEGCVIVELKSIQSVESIHRAQTLSYLRHSSAELALLLNFNVDVLKNGIERFVDDHS